jgi:hypothetical protein
MGMVAAYVSVAYTLKASMEYSGAHSSTVMRAVRRVEGEKPV